MLAETFRAISVKRTSSVSRSQLSSAECALWSALCLALCCWLFGARVVSEQHIYNRQYIYLACVVRACSVSVRFAFASLSFAVATSKRSFTGAKTRLHVSVLYHTQYVFGFFCFVLYCCVCVC